MKKLNLQLGSIKEMLSKEQMKKISGGYQVMCTYYESEFNDCPGGSNDWECPFSLANCRAIADSQCTYNDNCCTFADCYYE